jgi:hypothetical protein
MSGTAGNPRRSGRGGCQGRPTRHVSTAGGRVSAGQVTRVLALTIGDFSALGGLTVLIAGASTGISAYFIKRRASGGQVKTSDAATLWAQSQEMRSQILAEKTKAEDQRDRLMQIQADQVVPVLTSTANSLQQILAGFGELVAAQERMDLMLTEMHRKYLPGGGAADGRRPPHAELGGGHE